MAAPRGNLNARKRAASLAAGPWERWRTPFWPVAGFVIPVAIASSVKRRERRHLEQWERGERETP
jgi:hypothetical protein